LPLPEEKDLLALLDFEPLPLREVPLELGLPEEWVLEEPDERVELLVELRLGLDRDLELEL
jgi:hypothetical protein